MGPDFFAVVSTVGEELPDADPAGPGVIVLDLGRVHRYSSTMLKQLEHYVAALRSAGSGLVLLQVDENERRTLDQVGLLDQIGSDNVIDPDPHLDVYLETGLHRGRELLAELQSARANEQA
jgi:hypothetical protein